MSSHKQTWIKHLLSEKQMSEAFVNSVFLALSEAFRMRIHTIQEMRFFQMPRREMLS